MHYSVANFVLTDTCPDKCKKRDCGLKMESSPNHMALNNFGICEGYCSLDGYCWKVWGSSSTNCTGCILGKLFFRNFISNAKFYHQMLNNLEY